MYLLNKDGLVWFFQPNGCLLVYHRRIYTFPYFPSTGGFLSPDSHPTPRWMKTVSRNAPPASAASASEATKLPKLPATAVTKPPRHRPDPDRPSGSGAGARGEHETSRVVCFECCGCFSCCLKMGGGGKFWCVYAVFSAKVMGSCWNLGHQVHQVSLKRIEVI